MTRRIAMISDHASPLATLGGTDAGGQNVYVAHVARHLAAGGSRVDVYLPASAAPRAFPRTIVAASIPWTSTMLRASSCSSKLSAIIELANFRGMREARRTPPD